MFPQCTGVVGAGGQVGFEAPQPPFPGPELHHWAHLMGVVRMLWGHKGSAPAHAALDVFISCSHCKILKHIQTDIDRFPPGKSRVS